MPTSSSRSCQSCGATVSGDLPCIACSLAGVITLGDHAVRSSKNPQSFSPFELPSAFGHYRVEREIAAGGAGIVYEAVDTVINRPVALKMLRQVLFSTEKERVRFQTEAELVSQMDHPHIVPIYDVGKIEGQPYFTMKLIREGNLAQRLDAGKLPPREAAILVKKIAHAVHHAHQRGVLHRDLKPSNILLDGDSQPLLTDFGLAKWLDSDSELTITQTISGTPNYMSPEQVVGDKGAVSTATDVWSLGVMFYQMLTGCLPFRGESNAEIFRAITEREPAAPSKLTPVDPDLETLCLRCLQKVPDKRLSSAQDLAQDLGRWLEGEPIESRRITTFERLVKWTRRHPYRTAAIGLMSLVMLVSAAAVTWQWRAAERSAETERQTAYAAILGQALSARERHDFGQARRLLDSIDPKRRGFDWRLLHGLCRGDEELAFRLGTGQGDEPQCLTRVPGEAHLAIISADGRLHLRNSRGGEMAPPRLLPALPDGDGKRNRYRGLTISPNGQRLAYANGDTLYVLAADSLEVLCQETSRLPQFDWLDDDHLLFGFNGSVARPPYPEAGAWILDLQSVHGPDQEVPRTALPQMCAPLAVSPDRRSFVLHRVDTVPGSWARTLHVYQADQDVSERPAAIYSLPGKEYPGNLTLSHGGKYLALTSGVQVNRAVRVLDVATGKVLADHQFRFPVHALTFDPQARRLGLVGDDGVIRVYDFTRGMPAGAHGDSYDDDVKLAHRQHIDGRGAHTPPSDLITRSAQDGRAQFFLGHENRVFDLVFDAAGLLVTAGGDGTIRRWPAHIVRPALPIGHLDTTYKLSHPAASRDGQTVLFNIDRAAYLGDVSAQKIGWVESHHAPLAVLADGRPITQDRDDTEIVVWTMGDNGFQEQKRLKSVCAHPSRWGQTRRGSLSRDETRLAGVMDGWLFTADLEKERVAWSGAIGASDSAFSSHAISPDGEWVASSDFGPRVSIHPFADPSTIVTFLKGEARDQDTAVAFGHDGRWLYVGNADGSVRVWETNDWKQLPERSWPAHRGAVTAIALSHDETLIATSGDDTLKLFPAAPKSQDHQRREHLSFHLDQPANWIQFARGEDGKDRALLHSAPGRRLEIWEADLDRQSRKALPESPDLMPRSLVNHSAIRLPDGQVLLAGGEGLTANAKLAALSECYLYDPARNTWTPTGSMLNPRCRFGPLTLLSNGTVLAVGGPGRERTTMGACEIYDPESGSWRATGSMIVPRVNASRTLLPDGRLLVSGGRNAALNPLASCELYDPHTGTWRLTASLRTARFSAPSALLPDGTVLAIGGHDGRRAIDTCERYEPRTESWQPAAPISEPRTDSLTMTLTNGDVLLIGGLSSGKYFASCERYEAATQTWSKTAALPQRPLVASAAILMPTTGQVFFQGRILDTMITGTFLYDPETSTWHTGPSLRHPRMARTATLLDDGNILVTGGHTSREASRSVEIMDSKRFDKSTRFQ